MKSPSITLNKAIVMDKTEHYYAFGNTPPDLLLPPGVVNPKILCLAAGDLRSCLFSISRTDMTRHSNILFVINDKNSAIIARNILLLAVLIHPDLSCEWEDIWSIWYSISLSRNQWNLVEKVLRCLLNDPQTLLSKLNTTVESSTLLACEEVWKMWLEMEIPAKKADKMQKKYLKRYSKASDGQEMYNYFVSQGYIASTFVNKSNGKSIRLPTLHLEEEHLSELCVSFSNHRFAIEASDLVVNKTMFMSPNRYNLHYCSAYYRSYHLWSFRPSRESLYQFCQSQFAQWVRGFRSVSKKVEFTLPKETVVPYVWKIIIGIDTSM